MQTGNVLTVYGGSRDAPSAANASSSATTSRATTRTASSARAWRIGTDSINAYFPGAVFLRNVLAGGRSSRYPGDNLFPEMDSFAQQFVNYAGGDYRLRAEQRVPARARPTARISASISSSSPAPIGARAREWLGLS